MWGRGSAYLGRSGQSMFDEREARVQLYVDDPFVTFRRSVARNRHNALVLLLWWVCLGPRISWGKSQLSQCTTWIGAVIGCKIVGEFTVSIPAAYIDKLRQETDVLLELASVELKRLQRFAGSANWVAGIVPVLRSFLSPFWAAMGDNSGRGGRESGDDDHDVSGRESTQCTAGRVTSDVFGGTKKDLVARSVGCPYVGFVTHSLGYVRSGSNRTVCSYAGTFSVPVDGQLAFALPQMRAHGVLARGSK